ncbi:hypothetical protein DGMP_22400 [Desulfomarina profundi]|uniref:Uncharacterized protein n=1 Tax=Desulfomarina profundi TaxID=2772557 RepID=A0A8D5FX34_9BACT|nr:hypothetical protein DGMP_22400 [Desulfomarina profundi]
MQKSGKKAIYGQTLFNLNPCTSEGDAQKITKLSWISVFLLRKKMFQKSKGGFHNDGIEI